MMAQREDNLEAAGEAMDMLDLIDRCAVFCSPLLQDRQQTIKAIAALLSSIIVLARRLDDEERFGVAMQLLSEAQCLVARRIH